MLQYNIISDVIVMAASSGLIKFKKKNKFDFNGTKVEGILLQEEGAFIITSGNKMFEIDEDDETFMEFGKNPYNYIQLYESVVNELKLNEKK